MKQTNLVNRNECFVQSCFRPSLCLVKRRMKRRISVFLFQRKESREMAHFEKLDEQHPYYAIAAARMWQKPETKPVTTARFYWKFAAFNFISER